MELPIKIMLTLFVALVVAGLAIFLARTTVDSAKNQMMNLQKELPPEKLIDKGSSAVTTSEVVYLAEECYRMGLQDVFDKTEICFLVLGPVAASRQDVVLRLSGVIAGFDASLVDDISGSGSVSVLWNSERRTVEVRR